MKKTKKKGQMTLIGIIMGVIAVLTFSVVLPVLNQGIALGKSNTNSTTLQLIFDMYPILMGLAIMIAIISYATFVYPNQ